MIGGGGGGGGVGSSVVEGGGRRQSRGSAASSGTVPVGGSSSLADNPLLRVPPEFTESQMEHVVLEGSGGDRAVLSFYSRAPLAASRSSGHGGGCACLWLPGRNDAFFHPHVAALLASHGIDLYVLSYRLMGVCRAKGLFDNPMHNSHCRSGSFSEYREDISQALSYIRERTAAHGGGRWMRILGYGHSTGAPILLDYVMHHGDQDFAGFIFNSPFLDWGYVGGALAKMVVVHAPYLLTRLGYWTCDTELLGGGGPSAWALQLWSQYPFMDLASRPLYNVPVTIGYCLGVNGVHAALRERARRGVAITRKPFVVFTSMHDDILEGDRVSEAAHAIGPSRTKVSLCHARHDVFVSAEPSVVGAGLEYLRTWLVSQGYPPVTSMSLSEQQQPRASQRLIRSTSQ